MTTYKATILLNDMKADQLSNKVYTEKEPL